MAVRQSAARRFVSLVLMAAVFTTMLPAVSAEAATAGAIRDGIKMRINQAREDRGLRPLRYSSLPCKASLQPDCMQDFAQGHARNMGNKGDIFHDGATKLWDEVPLGAWWRAENVGYVTSGDGEASRMHRAFMGSAGHRENILKKRATHIAIGVYKADGKVWVVQRFADMKPLDL